MADARSYSRAEMELVACTAATLGLGLPIERSADGRQMALVAEAEDAARRALADFDARQPEHG